VYGLHFVFGYILKTWLGTYSRIEILNSMKSISPFSSALPQSVIFTLPNFRYASLFFIKVILKLACFANTSEHNNSTYQIAFSFLFIKFFLLDLCSRLYFVNFLHALMLNSGNYVIRDLKGF